MHPALPNVWSSSRVLAWAVAVIVGIQGCAPVPRPAATAPGSVATAPGPVEPVQKPAAPDQHLLALPHLESLPPALTGKSEIRVWVDQMGYRPATRKLAIIASDKALPEDLHAILYDAKTLAPVWDSESHGKSVTLFHDNKKDAESAEFVAHIDFTDFRTPGRYFFVLNGAPERSYQFNIASDVYSASATAAWRMFYYQRCDTELPEKFAGPWGHGLDHHGPNQATAAREYKWTGGPWYTPVGKEVADPTPYDVSGGWWDAGDFDKYMGNMSLCHNHLLFGQQILNFMPGDKSLNLPESGNGAPDGMDEIRFTTELLLRMADKDGAAFGKVYENPTCPPEADKSPVQLTKRTAGATINRMADLAYAAVVWKQAKLDPAFAGKCQEEAIKAWKLIQAKPYPWEPDPEKPHEEANSGAWFHAKIDQSMALAAASLFALTGEKQYDAAVHAELGKVSFKPDDLDWYPAVNVYMQAPGADAALVASLKEKVIAASMKLIETTGAERGYAAGLSGYGWGSNRAIGTNSSCLIYAAMLTSDPAQKAQLLAAAEEFVHYLHGRNPVGLCYLTNMKEFGAENSAMIMFHSWLGNPSKQRDPFGSKYIGEGPGKIGPPPGYVVGGANGDNKKPGAMKAYQMDLSGSPWVWNEPDITYQSPCVIMLSYFGYVAPAQRP